MKISGTYFKENVYCIYRLHCQKLEGSHYMNVLSQHHHFPSICGTQNTFSNSSSSCFSHLNILSSFMTIIFRDGSYTAIQVKQASALSIIVFGEGIILTSACVNAFRVGDAWGSSLWVPHLLLDCNSKYMFPMKIHTVVELSRMKRMPQNGHFSLLKSNMYFAGIIHLLKECCKAAFSLKKHQ